MNFKKLFVLFALALTLGAPFALAGSTAPAAASLTVDGPTTARVVHCFGGQFDFLSCAADPLLTLGDCIELRQICEGGGSPF